ATSTSSSTFARGSNSPGWWSSVRRNLCRWVRDSAAGSEYPTNQEVGMTNPTVETPAGTNAVPGVVHHPSPLSVDGTVEALTDVIAEMGAKTFAVVDHSGEAKQAGLALRDTNLVIFGSPAAGTP